MFQIFLTAPKSKRKAKGWDTLTDDAKMLFFVLSLAMFFIDLVLVFGIWARGKRGAYLNTFFAIGLIFSAWALLNPVFRR